MEQLIKAIENMSFNDFYNRFMGETGVMEIVSPPPGVDLDNVMDENMNALKSIWIPNYEPDDKKKKKPKKKKK